MRNDGHDLIPHVRMLSTSGPTWSIPYVYRAHTIVRSLGARYTPIE